MAGGAFLGCARTGCSRKTDHIWTVSGARAGWKAVALPSLPLLPVLRWGEALVLLVELGEVIGIVTADPA